MIYYTNYISPIGELVLTSDGTYLSELYLKDQRDWTHLDAGASRQDCLVVFTQVRTWLDAYFGLENPPSDRLDIDPHGTNFQKKIWSILRDIPYGTTTSYGQIAKIYEEREGKRTSARAVGSATSKNPILIITPCHRVVGRDGSLTGFSAGMENKIKLLRLENTDLDGLYDPLDGTRL